MTVLALKLSFPRANGSSELHGAMFSREM